MIPEEEYVRLVCNLNADLRGVQAMLSRPKPDVYAALYRLAQAQKYATALQRDLVDCKLL